MTFQNENCCRPQTDPCSAAMSPDVCKEQRNSVKERIEDQTGPMGGKVQDMGGGGTKKHQHANSTTFACLSSYSLYNYKNTTGWGGGGGSAGEKRGTPTLIVFFCKQHSKRTGGGQLSDFAKQIPRAECLSALTGHLLNRWGHSQKTELHCSPRPQSPMWSIDDPSSPN